MEDIIAFLVLLFIVLMFFAVASFLLGGPSKERNTKDKSQLPTFESIIRQHCIDQTDRNIGAAFRIKEAQILYDYILNGESIITKEQ